MEIANLLSHSRFIRSRRDSIHVLSYVYLLGCSALVLASQLIAKILFRTDYYQAWILVPPLVIAALFEAYAGFLTSIYAVAKKTKFLSVSTSVGAVVNIVLNFALIKLLGAIGAPIATMLSFVMVWLMRLKVMKSFMPLKINIVRQIISISIVVVSGVYYAFQCPYKYMAGAVAVMVIVIINIQDTKNLFGFVKKTVHSIGKNKGERKQ